MKVTALASGDPEWLTTREAAERLGVTTRMLYRLVDEGDLPSDRMGRVFRLQSSDVDRLAEWLRGQE